MEEAVIVSACRTAIGKFQGALAPLAAPKLGAVVVREAIRRAGIEASSVQEVILGNVLSAGLGQNPARQAALAAGVPNGVGALTINKVCGSGLKAVMLAAQAIRAGDAEVIVAGGMESMTNAPYLLPDVRAGQRLGNGRMLDSLVHDGLWDAHHDFHMGATAELVADKYAIPREAQDEYACGSHRRAALAQREGAFQEEIVRVDVPQPKGAALAFEKDEGPREDASVDRLSRLRPAFREDGTVTAGNASTINDGASALVLMSRQRAQQAGLRPLARITGYATGGLAPEWVMMAPTEAVKNLTARTQVEPKDYDLIEINEAFSVAALALLRELKLDATRVNVHGGAVALGHPIGCSGARILTTLLYALKRRDARRGLATLCLGGGNAVAVGIEREL
ncbi:MAG: acetyl-CoA C-acetyltransferase [Planctomycetes bacterium]|nr:acetyl-CoA C-acetyltransferase [Planctomycetota bacterium]